MKNKFKRKKKIKRNTNDIDLNSIKSPIPTNVNQYIDFPHSIPSYIKEAITTDLNSLTPEEYKEYNKKMNQLFQELFQK